MAWKEKLYKKSISLIEEIILREENKSMKKLILERKKDQVQKDRKGMKKVIS